MQARMIPAIPSSWLIRDQNTQLPIQGARDHSLSRKIVYEINQRFTCRSGLGRHSSDDARGCICSRGRRWWGRRRSWWGRRRSRIRRRRRRSRIWQGGGGHAFVGGGGHGFGGGHAFGGG